MMMNKANPTARNIRMVTKIFIIDMMFDKKALRFTQDYFRAIKYAVPLL